MRCPFCRSDNDRVIDSRSGDDGATIRRRRECLACRRRFTTYERVERQLLTVVKKEGVRDPFDRDKIKRGLAKACWKRPVTEDDIEGVVVSLEAELYGAYESDVPSRVIGERLMELLKRVLDIDRQQCPNSGGELRIIAALLEQPVVEKILSHLGPDPQPQPMSRAREVGQDCDT